MFWNQFLEHYTRSKWATCHSSLSTKYFVGEPPTHHGYLAIFRWWIWIWEHWHIFYLTYYPSRVEFDCFLKHIPSPVEQTSPQGQFHWIWQFLTIVWLRLLISYVPSKTDCNYGTPVEGSINEKAQNSEQLGPWTYLTREINGRDIGIKMDPFPVQLLFSWAPVLFEPSCSPLAVSWTPEKFQWEQFRIHLNCWNSTEPNFY